MINEELLEKSRQEIEHLADKVGESFYDFFMEPDNTTYEIGKWILHIFSECKTNRDFEFADNMLNGICGHCFESILEDVKEKDAAGHEWESC